MTVTGTMGARLGSVEASKGWGSRFLFLLYVVLIATTVVPFLYTIALSLSGSGGRLLPTGPLSFESFWSVLSADETWQSLWLSIVFLVGALAIELVLGIVIAVVVEQVAPTGNFLRTLLLWPIVLPPIATALVFKFILQSDVGMVSYYLSLIGIDQEWLTQPATAMALIVGVDVWQYTPFVILLTAAALKTVSGDVLEAAQLDGANIVRTVWSVVLPIIRPALVSIALLRFIDAVQVFPTIYVLTRGGPGTSTQVLTYYNFQVFFGQLRFGEGAAISILVVAFTLACVFTFVWAQRRLEGSRR